VIDGRDRAALRRWKYLDDIVKFNGKIAFHKLPGGSAFAIQAKPPGSPF